LPSCKQLLSITIHLIIATVFTPIGRLLTQWNGQVRFART